jgi:hypothetical protein
MYIFWLFLMIFFGIFGAVKALLLAYSCILQRISKKEDDVKIWVKLSNQ